MSRYKCVYTFTVGKSVNTFIHILLSWSVLFRCDFFIIILMLRFLCKWYLTCWNGLLCSVLHMCIPFSEGYILRLSLHYLPIFNICNRFLSTISHVNFNYGFQFGVFCSFFHFIYPPFISIILKVSAYRGWPRGRVVKFAHSAAGGPVFR